MKDKRQGNDLKVAWSIFMQDGEPFRLDGKDVSLYLKNMFGRKELNDFVTTGNIIQWTFYGKDQKNTGKYSLELVINEGEKGMITTDKCDFVNLVSCSCKLQGGEDSANVETESIELTSTLEYVSGGGDYDDTALWNALESKVDKVNGKGLSSNDYTDEDKSKLAGLENYDDTDVKNELARLEREKADKQELTDYLTREEFNEVSERFASADRVQELSENVTELSAEVSGLSEKIENLPSAESDVVKAIYGETTIEEVTEAYNAGKVIHCDYDGKCYVLSSFASGQAFFTCVSSTYMFRLELKQDSRWAIATFNYENSSNKVKTISESSTDTQYPSAKAVYDAIQQSGGGGASSDKQGVVSQTLTYNSADNTYSVSNVVRGAIPSFFIDLVTEAGASFNAESGYFSLNGIDNIAYDEMRQIYNCRTGYGVNSLLAVYGKTYTARTNFAAFRGFGISYANHQPTTFYTKYLCYYNASLIKFVIHNEGIPLFVRADSVNNFEGWGTGAEPILRSRLEEIVGIIDVSNLSGSANFFYNGTYKPWLTSFQLKSLKASIDLSGMPRLSEATILYMINNEKATAAITIKLHADAKAMADASEAIQSALSNHANITLGV